MLLVLESMTLGDGCGPCRIVEQFYPRLTRDLLRVQPPRHYHSRFVRTYEREWFPSYVAVVSVGIPFTFKASTPRGGPIANIPPHF